MKKFILILFMLMSTAFALPYAQKCKVCMKPTNPTHSIGIAYRDFGTDVIWKDGYGYATYKCCYGHKYLVKIRGDK